MICCLFRAFARIQCSSRPSTAYQVRVRGVTAPKYHQQIPLPQPFHRASRSVHLRAPLLHYRHCLSWRNAHFHTNVSATAVPSPDAAFPGVSLPLCERPIQAEVSQQELISWHAQGDAQAGAVGTAFEEADGGPSAEDLQVELNWLLDDVVAAYTPAGGASKPSSWRQLQSVQPALPQSDDAKVGLRLDLYALSALWNQRIKQRVPLQYLNNCCHWRDMILAVGPGVLIPRPETELLIDFASQALQRTPALGLGPWLDLGTGSGAIALGLASILPPGAQVYAVDKSHVALAWAKLNVERLNLTDSVQLRVGEWYSPVQELKGKIAGIISNPPYIPHSQMKHLQKEVGHCEPWLALNGGQGLGLDSLTPICAGAAEMLQTGGFLALETTGGKQAGYVASSLQCNGMFQDVETVADLAGHRRFVQAFKK